MVVDDDLFHDMANIPQISFAGGKSPDGFGQDIVLWKGNSSFICSQARAGLGGAEFT